MTRKTTTRRTNPNDSAHATQLIRIGAPTACPTCGSHTRPGRQQHWLGLPGHRLRLVALVPRTYPDGGCPRPTSSRRGHPFFVTVGNYGPKGSSGGSGAIGRSLRVKAESLICRICPWPGMKVFPVE